MNDPNRVLLEAAARALLPLLEDLVFLGGSTIGLLVTDPAAASVRATDDVDVITQVGSYGEYETLSGRLRQLGLTEDTREDAPMCRWRFQDLVIDVMPTDERILGFSSRWYAPAMRAAQRMALGDLQVRVITAPYFLATKVEAFHGRGNHDIRGSHDLEDAITVIDGRAEIVEEVREVAADVRAYIAKEMERLLSMRAFVDALPGFLLPDAGSQARGPILVARLRALAALDSST